MSEILSKIFFNSLVSGFFAAWCYCVGNPSQNFNCVFCSFC